ncbi:MAG: hypothetical protein COB66_08815 [Coxiella sp. (in: Bacteria)]|nr:MAG: hypothetical protein COB66_08815 [Coxiella sp. (in: g-proteobacteria)]
MPNNNQLFSIAKGIMSNPERKRAATKSLCAAVGMFSVSAITIKAMMDCSKQPNEVATNGSPKVIPRKGPTN